MTRPVRQAMVKEEDGSVISDHLRNHVHLTNYIHLKNHMHKQSPVMAERSLVRDLLFLQRSRSLRDPSTSPPSWYSPSIGVYLQRKFENDGVPYGGRRSVEYVRESGGLFASPPQAQGVSKARVASAEVDGDGDDCVGLVLAERIGEAGESSKKNLRSSFSGGSSNVHQYSVSGKAEKRENRFSSHLGSLNPNKQLPKCPEQLGDVPGFRDAENTKFSDNNTCIVSEGQATIFENEQRASGHIHATGATTRGRRRKFKGIKRTRGLVNGRDSYAEKRSSLASSSLVQGTPTNHGHHVNGDVQMEVTPDPRNGCGIPWIWSGIHDRGKFLLDKAGRSLSCGHKEARMRRDEHAASPSQRDNTDAAAAAETHSHSSDKSVSDALPLLNEPYDSHGMRVNPFSDHEYSGELAIFASHHEIDSDLTSEAGSNRARGSGPGRHRSLAQKYMPKTFRDLVGQNLVVQALSNAILRKKIGFLYVFHGPQGTGKTSCARIFAKALNCQSIEHSKPCGCCTSCISQSLGKSRTVVEVGPVGNFDFEKTIDVFENTMLSSLPPRYRVFIVDDCDTLPIDSWNAISKVIDRAPRRVVFLLLTSNANHLPHIITSRCQKFFFPKLKDADIVLKLQFIAVKEGLEIDRDALKLIASRADGSLRDAEMTLDQLSLLGQKISVLLVQELAGLVSNDKLVNLLDLALSADTGNTVKCLREIMEAGVEPLALMTQLATIITDILAGSYVFSRERIRRKFFCGPKLSKDDMEKLRQALKTLSEAEKQLRTSNDKLTWLTAALLQLAPDHQYVLTNSSADASLRSSPVLLNYIENISSKQDNMPIRGKDMADGGGKAIVGYMDTEKIWNAVIEKIHINPLKQFMHREGKLINVSFGTAPTVQILFNSQANKSKAEKFLGQIMQAFESVLSTAVTIEMKCESSNGSRSEPQYCLNEGPGSGNRSHLRALSKDISSKGLGPSTSNIFNTTTLEKLDSETNGNQHVLQSISQETVSRIEQGGKVIGPSRIEEASCSLDPVNPVSFPEKRDGKEQSRRQSIVKGKVSLAHVIQQAEGCRQGTGWSRRKAISIAEKLEQENLRLEPRSRGALYGKAKRITRAKLLRFRVRTRQPQSLLNLMSCGRCYCAKTSSPRREVPTS